MYLPKTEHPQVCMHYRRGLREMLIILYYTFLILSIKEKKFSNINKLNSDENALKIIAYFPVIRQIVSTWFVHGNISTPATF